MANDKLKITIFRYGRPPVKTEIPRRYVEQGLTAYWVDVVCKEDCDNWIKYKIEEDK